MYELFKEVFDSLPHVQRVWVDDNMNAYLHPKKGCEIVEREVATESNTKTEDEKPLVESKKGKKK